MGERWVGVFQEAVVRALSVSTGMATSQTPQPSVTDPQQLLTFLEPYSSTSTTPSNGKATQQGVMSNDTERVMTVDGLHRLCDAVGFLSVKSLLEVSAATRSSRKKKKNKNILTPLDIQGEEEGTSNETLRPTGAEEEQQHLAGEKAGEEDQIIIPDRILGRVLPIPLGEFAWLVLKDDDRKQRRRATATNALPIDTLNSGEGGIVRSGGGRGGKEGSSGSHQQGRQLSNAAFETFYFNIFTRNKPTSLAGASLSASPYMSSESFAGEFLQALRTPLPMTIRLMYRPFHYGVSRYAKDHLERLTACSSADAHATATDNTKLQKLQWIQLKTSSSPAELPTAGSAPWFKCSHVVYHTANLGIERVCRELNSLGAATFQEEVSLIPVLALDAHPTHTVLDMCASPGSKTLNALDCMSSSYYPAQQQQGQPGERQGKMTTVLGSGVVLACEKEKTKATQTLPSRIKRHRSPNCVVTHSDSTKLPMFIRADSLSTPSIASGGEESRGPSAGLLKATKMEFDRILCDVPCSGDGTVRKDNSIWATWSASYSASLVPTQWSLLRRGIDLLAPGGRLVYSTCTLNPNECEAMIGSLLCALGGAVRLVDPRPWLPQEGFVFGQGLVVDADVLLRAQWQDRADTPAGGAGKRPGSCCGGKRERDSENNSATAEEAKVQSELDEQRRQRCSEVALEVAEKVVRVMPHVNNTGAFFVAVLERPVDGSADLAQGTSVTINPRKVNAWSDMKRYRICNLLPSSAASAVYCQEHATEGQTALSSCAAQSHEDTALVASITAFYGFTPGDVLHFCRDSQRTMAGHSPRHTGGAMEASNNDPCLVFQYPQKLSQVGEERRIVLFSAGVRRLLFETKLFKGAGLPILHAGLRLFDKYSNNYVQGSSCRWRIANEAAHFIAELLLWKHGNADPGMLHTHSRFLRLSPATEHRGILHSLLREGFVPLQTVTEAWLDRPQQGSTVLPCSEFADAEAIRAASAPSTLFEFGAAEPNGQAEITRAVIGGVIVALPLVVDPPGTSVEWWYAAGTLTMTNLEVLVAEGERMALVALLE